MNRQTIHLLTFISLFVFGSYCITPQANAADFQEISAPEAKRMHEEGNTVFIHLLSRIQFEMQHIPGSINIPITEFKTANTLPKDKNTPIILYCMGKL